MLRCAMFLAAVFTMAELGVASAQDSQYWTNQYGNEARLLGGSVIGSSADLSTVFYNPGRLALTEDRGVVLAGNVFRLTNIQVKDALGIGDELSDTKIGGVPSLFSGELRFGFLGDHRLAYSFLTRQDINFRVQERVELRGSESPIPTLDLLAAGVSFEQDMDEYWAGLTWAHQLGRRVGIGVTQFLAIRNQRTRAQTLLQATSQSGEGAVALSQFGWDFQHWRLLWKLGVGADMGRWKVGLSLTTPGVKIRGSAKATGDEAIVTEGLDGSGNSASEITTTSQEDLAATYRSPLSIGVGASYQIGATRFHASAEWFDQVSGYEIISPAPVYRPDGSPVDFRLIQELNSVTNLALGVEHSFGPTVSAYGGFRTDNTGVDTQGIDNASLSEWDIYHASAGTTFTSGASAFTIGGIIAWGSAPLARGLTLAPGTTPVPLPPELETSFLRFTFILGFSIGI